MLLARALSFTERRTQMHRASNSNRQRRPARCRNVAQGTIARIVQVATQTEMTDDYSYDEDYSNVYYYEDNALVMPRPQHIPIPSIQLEPAKKPPTPSSNTIYTRHIFFSKSAA